MDRAKFEELKHSNQLPSPSGVGMQILVLSQDEDCGLDDIVGVIQADPALTGRIIRLASSAQAAGRAPIATARDAAVRLGMRTVSNLALGFTLISGNRSGRCEGFRYDEYWSWSLANAVAAELLSRETGIAQPAEAFTCGLLARIGELALASVHPTDYAAMLSELDAGETADRAELERLRFGIDHRDVAAALLQDWGLPKTFQEVIGAFGLDARSAHFEELESPELFSLLGTSAAVANLCVADRECPVAHLADLKAGGANLGIERAQLSELFDRVAPSWEQWGEMLNVPTKDVLSFDDLQEKSASSREAGSTSRHDPLRILAVDDDPVSLRVLVRHLEREGHQVITARHGREALAKALHMSPQIVVTDWMMPHMDGIQLSKALRKNKSLGEALYILILTGRDEEDRVVEAFDADVDDFVSKPFNPRLLAARIKGGRRVVRLQEQLKREIDEKKEQNSKLQSQERRLRDAAMTDPLTGMRNRRHAMERLEEAWANSVRASTSLSVIMLDIDNFKSVNDNYGHAAGDEVLKATSRAIEETLRRGDTCARIGGEEFLILCPNSDIEGARHVAERVRAAIERNHVAAGEFDGSVTPTLGAATRTSGVLSVDALLRLADEAVYEAKAGGRNRTVVHAEIRRRSA